MPGLGDGPTVALSFANNFWGKDDAGVGPILERMHNAKVTCDELRSFYNTRAAIEDEYSRKLLSLCRKSLGSCEAGTLRASLDVVRGETESIGKAHSAIASQLKSELEEPLVAFSGGMKERRKIVQNGIERLLKTKNQQTQAVNKAKDKYEQDCLRIKGYLAQGHMVMGQEERKNKAKLEKTQIQLASNSSEYETAVKILEETTGRWNKEWKSACDKFQDLEEERLDFTKSSLWGYANIASTVCVSDDASCERIRLSLENCEVEKDISSFIKQKGSGQEIPDPPKYINFCRGDINDTSSETSEEEHSYSVAQFQRTINPAFRSSSPQPSTYESHHDPQSELALQMSHGGSSAPSSREATVTPQKPHQQPAQQIQPAKRIPPAQPPPLDLRRGGQPPPNYHPSQHGEIGVVPHNSYPTDGMTMFCRTGPPSERSSGTSVYRPSSRDSQSECSNPTSNSSQEPPSAKHSPIKPTNGVPMPGMVSGKQVQKKRSAFFSNSPFRRKSRHEKERQSAVIQSGSRNGWEISSKQNSPAKSRYGMATPEERLSGSPEPVDPRANFQLNIGNNVFDVASPDTKNSKASKGTEDELDPIARALADLKGAGKPSTSRVSADRYHGLATPAPSSTAGSSYGPAPVRETPPPSYNDASIKRLDAPQPAFTSAQMNKTTQKYVGQTQNMFGDAKNVPRSSGRHNGQPKETPRLRLPIPNQAPTISSGANNATHVGGLNAVQPQEVPRAQSPAPSQTQTVFGTPNNVAQRNGRSSAQAQEIPRARSPVPGPMPVPNQTPSAIGASSSIPRSTARNVKQSQEIPRARSPGPSQSKNMFGSSNSSSRVAGRNGGQPQEMPRARSPGPSQTPNTFSSSNSSSRVTGRNGGQPQEMPRARSPGPSQTPTFGSSNSGARVNGRSGGQPQEMPRARSPVPSQTQNVFGRSDSGARVNGRSGGQPQEMPRARSPAPSQTQNMFGGSNSGAHVNGRNGERPREIHRTRSPGPSQDPSPSPTQTQNVFGSSNNGARVNGRNGGQPQEIPRARSPGPSQTQTQNMFGSLNSGARVNGRYGGQPQEIPRARSPAPSQTQSVSSNSNSGSRVNGRSGRHSQEIPRARSPAPRRSISPQPPREDSRSSQHSGGAYQSNGHNNSYRQSPSANTTQSSDRGYSPRTYSRHGSPSEFTRAVSPQPQFRQHNRPSSADGMELQLSANPVEAYGTDYDNHGSRSRDAGRPKSMYYGAVPETASRSRSKSLAVADPSRQYSRDGRPILHFARAKFNYAAVIPEELGFTKGDVLAIVRLQDDGWWEAEITGIHSHGRTGLVPSNYLQDL